MHTSVSVQKKPKLILPLMMFGKDKNQWHEKGQPVRERVIVGYEEYKTGPKKGKKKAIYEWVVKTHKRKVIVGYQGIFTRGSNKGQPKPLYETKDVPIMSSGFYPTVNHIYLNAGFSGGGGRRLKPIAENHLQLWKEIASVWQKENQWFLVSSPTKVAIDLVFYLPSGKKDTHNSKKLLLDALEGIVHENDYFMLDRTLDFAIDDDNPRIEASIYIPSNTMPL